MLGAALYMGTCSGHGKGNGCKFQPGHGGPMVAPCPHSLMDERILVKSVMLNEPVASWLPTAQLPLTAGVTNVIINKKVPIVDKDALIPHPTVTIFTTESVGDKCAVTMPTPAYHCTLGADAPRELKTGHPRVLHATSKTVYVNKKPLGRFKDPFGTMTGTGKFPCLSLVGGCSPNVFVGA